MVTLFGRVVPALNLTLEFRQIEEQVLGFLGDWARGTYLAFLVNQLDRIQSLTARITLVSSGTLNNAISLVGLG